MNPYPWHRLERVDRVELAAARQLRALLGPAAGGAVARWAASCLGGATTDVALERIWSAASAAVCQRAGHAVRFALDGPLGQGAWLAIDGRVAAGIIGALLGVALPPLRGEPSSVQRGVLEFALAALLNELEGCAWSVATSDEATAIAAPASAMLFEARVRVGADVGGAWLALDPGTSSRCAGPPAPRPGAARRRRLAAAQVQCAVTIGRFGLPLGECAPGALSVGDAIVSPTCPRAGAHGGVLAVGLGGFPVTVAWAGATAERIEVAIVGAYARGAGMVSESTDEQDDVIVAEDLPVDVVVEIGRVRLTGAQVMALSTGDVITLDRPVGAEVDLRVGGRLLARGALVDVDGEAGVRLVEVPG